MAIRSSIAVVCLTLVICGGINGQDDSDHLWGLALGIPGPVVRDRTMSLTGWLDLKRNFWVSGEIGVPGRGNTPRRRQDDLYRESVERGMIAIQGMYDVVRRSYFTLFVGTGPYLMHTDAEIGQSYFYNADNGISIAHSGAHFELNRIGLQNTLGFQFFTWRLSLGARLHIPTYYVETKFTDLTDPLEVEGFVPYRPAEYQEQLADFRAAYTASLYIGYVFNKREY